MLGSVLLNVTFNLCQTYRERFCVCIIYCFNVLVFYILLWSHKLCKICLKAALSLCCPSQGDLGHSITSWQTNLAMLCFCLFICSGFLVARRSLCMEICMVAPLKTNILSFLGCDLLSPNTECLNSDLSRRHSRFHITWAISVQRFVEVA